MAPVTEHVTPRLCVYIILTYNPTEVKKNQRNRLAFKPQKTRKRNDSTKKIFLFIIYAPDPGYIALKKLCKNMKIFITFKKFRCSTFHPVKKGCQCIYTRIYDNFFPVSHVYRQEEGVAGAKIVVGVAKVEDIFVNS